MAEIRRQPAANAGTRGDRQHSFWSKVESSTGRVVKE
jgi:hypothetical protein